MSSRFQILLQRASDYLNIGTKKEPKSDELDEEVVYSKNNVCVHSVDQQNQELVHNLGYLTIKPNVNKSDDQKSTICLQWTPNECLRKHSEISYDFKNNLQIEDQTNDYKTEDNYRLNDRLDEQNARNESLDVKNKRYEDIVFDFTNCDNNNKQNSSQLSCDPEIRRRNSTSDHEYNRQPPATPMRCQSCRSTPLKRSLTNEKSINTFSVDLRQIRSLRLFFEADEDTNHPNGDQSEAESSNSTKNGQLVVVSRDSFYKIFHFHCGGLDKLLNVLNGLDFWDKSSTTASKESNYLQFSICSPKLKTEECHPEEKLYVSVNQTLWMDSINELGQITDQLSLRKNIFFAGIEPPLRRHIWPFLLQRYDYESTYEQRNTEDLIKYKEYYQIKEKLDEMNQKERDWFWRNVESIVEKDVVRTDRSNPFFSGDNTENIDKMKRILINFALFCPVIGYTQGMSDLLAPLFSEIQSEDKTFWCFVAMMRLTRFVCSPKDTDMDHNLNLLRELLRIMNPLFYVYIRRFSDDLELLFTHRWILLCFKREFHEKEALHIWESCWAHYQTYYFHLFICLAIISVYGEDVITHKMDSDEILFHFSTLATNMNGNLILKKARGLFYEFSILPTIPCSLKNLTKSRIEMWETNREQVIECVKQMPNLSNSDIICQCNEDADIGTGIDTESFD